MHKYCFISSITIDIDFFNSKIYNLIYTTKKKKFIFILSTDKKTRKTIDFHGIYVVSVYTYNKNGTKILLS